MLRRAHWKEHEVIEQTKQKVLVAIIVVSLGGAGAMMWSRSTSDNGPPHSRTGDRIRPPRRVLADDTAGQKREPRNEIKDDKSTRRVARLDKKPPNKRQDRRVGVTKKPKKIDLPQI